MRLWKPAWLTANSLAFRFVAGAAFLLLVGLSGGGAILVTLFEQSWRKDFDKTLSDKLFSIYGELEIVDGGLRWKGRPGSNDKFNTPGSGWYWQILDTEKRPVEWSRSLAFDSDKVLALHGDFSAEQKPKPQRAIFYSALGPYGKTELRFAAQRLVVEELNNKPFYFVVAADAADVDKQVADFTSLLAWSFAILGLVMLVTVILQVRYGLAPLGRIPPALAAIRSGKADRLAGRFPTEVAPLAAEINALLDHNAQVVERARTQVGNLAHALKTPLAVLTNEAHGNTNPIAETVARQTGIMRDQVEHYLARARAAARAEIIGARTMVMPVVADLHRTLETIYKERKVAIAADGDHEAAFRGERQDLEEMLGNLMDNACKWAKAKVQVSVGAENGDLSVTIADDGPGLTHNQRRAALKRGARIDESAPGSGLGLSIVQDIADLYNGKLELEKAEMGGLAAVLHLPAVGSDTDRPSRRNRRSVRAKPT